MELQLNEREMLRYWGIKGTPSEQEQLVAEKAGKMAQQAISPKIVYETFPCTVNGENITIGTLGLKSRDLAKMLKNCDDAILLCATVGIGIDNLIHRYNGINMALSTAVSAAGSAFIETYLDNFCATIKKQWSASGRKATPRFSPGYGDVPLDVQTDFFRILNVTRRIGVTLNESLLMTPTKSVTAIIGIKNAE